MSRSKPLYCGLSLLALGAACGNYSQASARDLATQHSCDWYQKCNQVGAGKTFESRDACEVNIRAAWNSAWPAASCDGKITASDLNNCLLGIDNTQCANGLDLLNTLLNKCGQSTICSG